MRIMGIVVSGYSQTMQYEKEQNRYHWYIRDCDVLSAMLVSQFDFQVLPTTTSSQMNLIFSTCC
jgi:hypothetical protein